MCQITISPQRQIESYLMEIKFYISNINNYVSCQLSCHIPDKNMQVHVSLKWNKQIKKKKKFTWKIYWTYHKRKIWHAIYVILRFSNMHKGKIIMSLFLWVLLKQ